jgi:DNA-binding response OmpR family regulator
MMPRMSGLEVLQTLKSNPATAAIPIIMVTAKTTDDDVLHGYQQGADYYITKPFTADELVYGVNLVLGHQPSHTRPERRRKAAAGPPREDRPREEAARCPTRSWSSTTTRTPRA